MDVPLASFQSCKPYLQRGPHQTAGAQWMRLTPFQRILLIKCCRPPHVVFSITNFVKHSLGPRFIDPPPFDLHGSTADASAQTPARRAPAPATKQQ